MTTDVTELRNQLVLSKVDHQQTRVLLEQAMEQLRLVRAELNVALVACAAATERELEYQRTSQEMVDLVLPHIKVLIREAMIGRDGFTRADDDPVSVATLAEIEDAICTVGKHFQLGADDLADLHARVHTGGPMDVKYQELLCIVHNLTGSATVD